MRLIVLFCLVLAACPPFSRANAQEVGRRYFPETGHWVKGEFLAAYEQTAEASLLYGNPISDEFPTPIAGGNDTLVVQYFERVRFELHPQNPPDLRVVLSPLGEYLYRPDPNVAVMSVPANYPACRTFLETNHQVCYAFLEFFDAHGGLGQFGYPISEVEIREGRMVQYFQRARFEWHPDLPSGQRVVLTNLGEQYFELYEDLARRMPAGDAAPLTILEMRVRAFVEQAVLSPGDSQVIYAVVQNQTLRPIGQAQVTFIVRLPSGEQERYVMLADGNGIARLRFSTVGQPHGLVEVLVLANYDVFQAKTLVSYRIWW